VGLLAALALGAGLAVAQPASDEDKVELEYTHGTDFSAYKTYGWVPFQDPAANPANHIRVTRAVEKELEAKGLTKATDSRADVFVRYQGRLEKKVKGTPAKVDSPWQPTNPRFTVDFSKVQIGTLVLELYDGRTKDVVWHGRTSARMATPDRIEEQISAAVKLLLSRFPPPDDAPR
jgi:hypothetical protein